MRGRGGRRVGWGLMRFECVASRGGVWTALVVGGFEGWYQGERERLYFFRFVCSVCSVCYSLLVLFSFVWPILVDVTRILII